MEIFPQWAVKILKQLHKNGFEAFFVGGCVRDLLLHREPNDIDITTNALPSEIKECFSAYKTFNTGMAHGTITVLSEGHNIEVTTYRIDGDYTDNRHPDNVIFSRSLKEDLLRRDFTVNSLVCDEDGNITDFFGGINDLENKLIRCVGAPEKRFREDALRILRALRFSSSLSFDISNETALAANTKKDLLSNISRERIFSELCLLLCGRNIEAVLLKYTDILGVIIPELLPLKDLDQKNPHHIYDVLTHTAKVVSSIEPIPHLRLAALFHDIGKAKCFSADENGIGHFYGHASLSCNMANDILSRLKADNDTVNKVTTLIKYHDGPIEENTKSVKRRLNQLGKNGFFDLIKLKRADTKGLSPDFAHRQAHFDRLEEIALSVLNDGGCFQLKDLAVNGNDMKSLGFEGREIGNILKILLNSVINEELPNERKPLLSFAMARKSK